MRRRGLRVGLKPWSESVSESELLHSAVFAAVTGAAAGALDAVPAVHCVNTAVFSAKSSSKPPFDGRI